MNLLILLIILCLEVVESFRFGTVPFSYGKHNLGHARSTSLHSSNSFRMGLDLDEDIDEDSKLPLPANSLGIEDPDKNFIEWNPQIPDKKDFKTFFSSIALEETSLMSLDQLCRHPEIQLAMSDGLLEREDIDFIWDSDIAKDSEILDFEGAYELFCAIMDVPDPETIAFLNKSFLDLLPTSHPTAPNLEFNSTVSEVGTYTIPTGGITLETFLAWDIIEEVFDEGDVSKEQVLELWREIVGDDSAVASRIQFGKLYMKIAQYIDDQRSSPEGELCEDE